MLLKFLSKSIKSLGHFFFIILTCYAIFGSIIIHKQDGYFFGFKFLTYILSFEDRFYDYRLRNSIQRTLPSKDISLLKIDDYSLNNIGMWPLPRDTQAKMIDKLKGFGAKIVALDIMYPEKSPVCGGTSPDDLLVKSFQNFQANNDTKIFLAYSTGTSAEDSFASLPEVLINDLINTFGDKLNPRTIGKYTFPNKLFANSGVGLGSIANSEDPDGVFRNYLLLLNVDDKDFGDMTFGSLGYNAWEAFTGEKHTIKIFFNDGQGELTLAGSTLELNKDGQTKIRYIGGLEKFTNVSLYDLLEAENNNPQMIKAFKDKIVFVGSTADGAHDLRSSPIHPKMPGVVAHMNIANMLLTNHFFKKNNESIQFSLILLGIGLIVFFLVQLLDNALIDLIVVNLLLAGAYAIDNYYFFPNGYEIKLFSCFFCFISCYSWNTFFKFSEASKEKKQIKGTFARYVAPTIVDEMLKDPDKLHVGGFKRDITCLFSDVRDFTSISEGLTATELAHSLNMYMGAMTDIVFETKGTLDKYIGDAIVAFWGAPLEIGNHAEYAVQGAIKMMNTLPAINAEFKRLGRPQFNVGVGLNSGECNVGNMGSERIFSYTALGDNMNLGARLEGLCKYYGTQILISEYTLARIDQSATKVRPIDRVIVKGKTTPVAIYEVLHSWHPMTLNPKLFDHFLDGWNKFEKKNFQDALTSFNKVMESFEDKSTKRLIELCLNYLEHPELAGDDFNITKMTEK